MKEIFAFLFRQRARRADHDPALRAGQFPDSHVALSPWLLMIGWHR